jgi:hypothetical protein
LNDKGVIQTKQEVFVSDIIKGTVQRLGERGSALAFICHDDHYSNCSNFVWVRDDHYHLPVSSPPGKYGVDFGEGEIPRVIKLDDVVLIRRHRLRSFLSSQWCYEEDARKVVASLVVVAQELEVVAPELPHPVGKKIPGDRRLVMMVGGRKVLRSRYQMKRMLMAR